MLGALGAPTTQHQSYCTQSNQTPDKWFWAGVFNPSSPFSPFQAPQELSSETPPAGIVVVGVPGRVCPNFVNDSPSGLEFANLILHVDSTPKPASLQGSRKRQCLRVKGFWVYLWFRLLWGLLELRVWDCLGENRRCLEVKGFWVEGFAFSIGSIGICGFAALAKSRSRASSIAPARLWAMPASSKTAAAALWMPSRTSS